MKTRKFCLSLSWVILVVVAALAGYGFYLDNLNYVVIAVVIGMVFVLPLVFYQDYLKEKANPLNFDNRRKALAYAIQLKEGTKDDFVATWGEDMYEDLLNRGYLFELRSSLTLSRFKRWEITRLGQNYFRALDM